MLKIVFFCCATVVVAKCASVSITQQWTNFKSDFSKTYSSPAEEQNRQAIFRENLQKIEAHNQLYDQGKSSYFLRINRFSDLTLKEVQHYLGLKQQNDFIQAGTKTFEPTGAEVPDQIDWRELGAVTDVKNQGDCGSCWSFSATGALEAQYQIKTGNLTSLSEQNLIDCSVIYGNGGCGGGLMDNAFRYVRDYGIVPEDSYPYTAFDNGTCEFNITQSVLNVKDIVDIPSQNETDLVEAVGTVGPVSVGIDASSFSFTNYGGGVLDDQECGNSIFDIYHGVLVVGYGTSEDGDYYIVKNSYGAEWGENGYIKMSRNKNNQCGIATLASYALLQ